MYELKLKTLDEKIRFDQEDDEEKKKKIEKMGSNNEDLKKKVESQAEGEKIKM